MIYLVTNQTKIESIYTLSTIDECIEYFSDKNLIQIDTETTGAFDHNNVILTLQLGNSDNQWVIDFNGLSTIDKKRLNEELLLSDKLKILQNAKFDIKFLWRHGLDICNVYDTMLAEVLLNAGKETPKGFYSLYSMGKRYCNIELDKQVRGEIKSQGLTDRVIRYAAEDVKYLESIREQQMKQLIELDMANSNCQDIDTVLGLENNAVFAFAAMEYEGIKLDIDKWKYIEAELKNKVHDIKKELNDMVCTIPELSKYCINYVDLFTPPTLTTGIKWSSPQQKLKVLNYLDPNITDTSDRVLQKIKRKYPIAGKMIEFSKTNKLYTSFGKKMVGHINKYTGRIHTEFWQILDTGRVSSARPNMQQIPSRSKLGKEMRACFIADKGYKMVGGDYSGCELRIIAEFSQDPVWVNSFLEGKDLHSELCALTFNIDIKDVKTPTPFKPDIDYRDVQKTINFGLA